MIFHFCKKIRRKRSDSFGNAPTSYEKERMLERMDGIKIYHKEMCGKCRSGDIDETTWTDLEMDQIFLRINHTGSYIGEQILYHRMHDTEVSETQRESLEQRISFYTRDSKKRSVLEEKLSFIGKSTQDYDMPFFLMHTELWSIQNGWFLHVLQMLLLVFLMGTLLTEQILFISGLMILACTNLVIYVSVKQRYEAFTNSLGSLKQLLLFCQRITGKEYRDELAVPEEIVRISDELKNLSKRIIGWHGRKYAALTGDVMYLLQDYLFGMTLLDISMFYHIMKTMDGKQEQIMKLYEFAGEIDMSISVASFRESLPFYCKPDVGNKREFRTKGLIHPLLPDGVANDFVLKQRALITGANAAGKSTFMKAIAINAILAQTIHTCTAEEFSLPAVSIMTSMFLRDDVITGESYYIREAKRIKQMMDCSKNQHPLLIVIDEILKGTNTLERLAASSAILEYFTKLPHYMLVATHDIDLINEMLSKYDAFYFASGVTSEDIVFDYHIHKGKGGNSNAIALLSLLKYPREVTEMAKQKVG